MTNEYENEEDPILKQGREIVAANKALRTAHTITLTGGPADGQTFDIPAGVQNLSVEVNGETLTYLRSTREENVFVPYHA